MVTTSNIDIYLQGSDVSIKLTAQVVQKNSDPLFLQGWNLATQCD